MVELRNSAPSIHELREEIRTLTDKNGKLLSDKETLQKLLDAKDKEETQIAQALIWADNQMLTPILLILKCQIVWVSILLA